DRSSRWIGVLGVAAVAVGVLAEQSAFAWRDVGHWLPDLGAGWTLIGSGLVASWWRGWSRSSTLMAAAGAAWFAGTFSSELVYLHRGPLVHLLLTYPDERLRGRVPRVIVSGGYVAAVVSPLWRSEVVTIVAAVGLVALAAARVSARVGSDRRAARRARSVTVLFAAVLVVTAAARLAEPTAAAGDATLVAYDLALSTLAIAVGAGLIRRPWERPAVTDLVVEVGETPPDRLRAALALALGDPTLQLAYRLADRDGYVDAAGLSVALPAAGSDRQVTPIERDGEIVAALVHDPAVLDDPGLSNALASAASLAATNARLQADVRDQLDELTASRRRLLLAADDERLRLQQQLRDGAQRRLQATLPVLTKARLRAGTSSSADRLGRARGLLEHTLKELGELAGGLRPRDLADGDLRAGLAALAARAPVRVELSVTVDPLAGELETAAYFVVSEALANVAKYAQASRVEISVALAGDELLIAVVDDGVGGADPARGSGLRGLSDRVETLGGTLVVTSPPRAGTRVVARLPLAGVRGCS
ncbi:MAG: hypothetical protein QOJ89_732, partial [bacterium]